MDINEDGFYEDYRLRVQRSPKTGKITAQFCQTPSEIFYCPTGPSICYWNDDGNLIEATWTDIEGREHRQGDKPAYILRDPKTGIDYQIEYSKHGKKHRDNNKPAVILTCPETKVITNEQYWSHGVCTYVIERDPKTSNVIYSGSPRDTDLEPEPEFDIS